MSLLANLTTDDSIVKETDSLGSGGVLESGIYPATVTMAYVTKSTGGATGLVLNFKTSTGRDFRQTLWMTSGTAKGGKNYYEDKKGEKHYLPGFNHANALALLAAGKEIAQMDTETKLVNVYSPEAKAEVPTKVEVLMDLLNKEIIVGLIKQTVDKTIKNDADQYVPTGETREENEIDKLFRAKDGMTTTEIIGQAMEADFIRKWEAKWAGKTKDKSTGTVGAVGSSRPAANAATKKPTASLFA